MHRKIFYYRIKTQESNYGDIFLGVCLLRELSKNFPVLLDTTGCTENTKSFFKCLFDNNANVKFVHSRSNYLRIISLLLFRPNYTHILCLPGGHLHSSNTIAQWRYSFNQLVFAFLYYIRDIKTDWIGYSIGNLNTLSKFVSMVTQSKNRLNIVRDPLSAKVLANAKVENVIIGPDLCFLQKHSTDFLKEDVVGVSFRKRNSLFEAISCSNLETLYSCFSKDRKCEILLFSQVEEDNEVQQELYRRLSNGSLKLSTVEYKLDEQTYVSIYKRTKIIVSNRLHVLCLGMLYGCYPVPVLCRINDRKVSSFFEYHFPEITINYINDKSDFNFTTGISAEFIESNYIKLACNRLRGELLHLLARF